MFTGLIEEIGVVAAVEGGNQGSRFTVAASAVLDTVRLGDSIAVDGACMTVVAFEPADKPSSFSFEASPESLAKTNLSGFCVGRRVNLERPLTPLSRLGGHYVTGHVDGMARLVSIAPQGNSLIYTFEVETAELAELLVPKGSVAVLGISLTVNTLSDRRFSVAIIPHTLAHTNLDDYQPGDRVNIETDLLGKYVRRLLFVRSGGAPEPPFTVSAAELEPGVSIDVSTLAPAANAIRSTQAFHGSQIRTGGWFNFEHEPESSSP
jgi:riboflavin synthase